jgi:hypothetical protein
MTEQNTVELYHLLYKCSLISNVFVGGGRASHVLLQAGDVSLQVVGAAKPRGTVHPKGDSSVLQTFIHFCTETMSIECACITN